MGGTRFAIQNIEEIQTFRYEKFSQKLHLYFMPGHESTDLGSIVNSFKIAQQMCFFVRVYIDKIFDKSDHDFDLKIKKLSNKYFLTGDKMTTEEFSKIKAIIIKIDHGLILNTVLKIGTGVDKTDPSAVGVVVGKNTRSSEKFYHNSVKDLQKNNKVIAGAIKLDSSLFVETNAIQPIIHEASHKFAGTMDYVYFTDGVEARGEFIDKSKAIINADSYGWFIYKAYILIRKDDTLKSIIQEERKKREATRNEGD